MTTTPARKTAADLQVDFNFDTWEREVEVKPFVVVIGGKPYTATDMADIDYRELNAAQRSDDDAVLFKLYFPKDYEKILAAKVIRTGAMDKFTDLINEHYALGPTKGSGNSSGGTATQ